MNNAQSIEVEAGDVLRGIRAGNKTEGNYVVGRVVTYPENLNGQYIEFWGHNEHSGSSDRFILLKDFKVIRSYN